MTSHLQQTLIPGINTREIKQLIISETEITPIKLRAFSQTANPVGVSVGYDPRGHLEAIAIVQADDNKQKAVKSIIFKIHGGRDDAKGAPLPDDRERAVALLEEYIFCRSAGEVFAFGMADIAMSLLGKLGLHIARGVNVQSGFPEITDGRGEPSAFECIREAVGPDVRLAQNNINTAFQKINRSDGFKREQSFTDLTHRAWAAHFVAGYGNAQMTFASVKRIETQLLSPELLATVRTMVNTTRQVGALQPTMVKHQFTHAQAKDQGVDIGMKAYSNRIRPGQTLLVGQVNQSGETFYRPAVASSINGKQGTVSFDESSVNNSDKALTSVISTGPSGPTNAEARTRAILLRVLEGDYAIFDDNAWVCNILMPNNQIPWPREWAASYPPIGSAKMERHPARQNMNKSQQRALDEMLSPKPVTIIQGPPGTGKTTVIAAFVETALDFVGSDRSGPWSGIWLIAQSNVAARNIAEKLLKRQFTDFRLLVSADFKNGWNDHLYDDFTSYIIVSEEFRKLSYQRIVGVKVFISTLSMLSNRFLQVFLSRVPVRTLVVDEASQIKVAEYINVFIRFKDSLKKICFIGDPKQLPPFGADDVEDLKSIFEVPHLEQHWQLLNTQYRMPPQLGDFISAAVYDKQLLSWDKHPVLHDTPSIFFINVDGKERKTPSNSFENPSEVDTIVKLSRILQAQTTSYKIITPYDGQRSLIEKELQNSEDELTWENLCFNVDSFQGNEEDEIVISIVRSRTIGFLNSLRRTNVMLTRCKRKMYIITSQQFLVSYGAESLVGNLATSLGKIAWVSLEDIEKGKA